MKKLLALFALLCMAAAGMAQVTFTYSSGNGHNGNSNEGMDKLFDNNTSTKYCGNAGNDCYALFTASEPVYVWGYEMTTANDNADNENQGYRLVKRWTLCGTNDASVASDANAEGWVTLSGFAKNNFIQKTNYNTQRFFCDKSTVGTAYKYFKIVLNEGNGSIIQLSEFKLCCETQPIVTYNWKEGHYDSSTTDRDPETMTKNAVDWLLGQKMEGNDLSGSWVTIETSDGKPYPVKSYSITTHDDGEQPNRAPKTWKVEGSNDNSNWTTIHEVTEGDPIENKNYKTYDFTPTNTTSAFRYVRLTLNSMKGTGWTQLGEFHVVGNYEGGENPKTYIQKVENETLFDRQTLSAEDPWYTEYKNLYDGLNATLADAFISANYGTLQANLDKIATLKTAMTNLINSTSGFMALNGTDGGWSDGDYSHLMDGNLSTKWGGGFSGSEGDAGYVQWVIYRSKNAIQPYFYKLITGGDTSNNPGRNWKDWKIYGGNMEYDDASVESTDWDEIDSKTGVGQDVLPRKDQYMVPFGFSGSVTKPYYYFMVKVTKAYSGNSIQMNELILGTSDDFAALKEEYMDELDKFVVPDAATTEQKSSYATAKSNVDEATPENLLTRYSAAKALQKEIFSSLKVDGWYQISSKYDMDFFSELVNGDEPNAKGALTQDIDMDGIILTPFGRSKDFTGQFDGQGHVIENFVSDNPKVNELGLFANTSGATIQSVILKNASVVGRNNTGAIVGKAVNTTIQNCAVVDSYVEGYDHVGSIAGDAEGGTQILKNYSNSEIKTREYQVGGMIGVIKDATVTGNLFTGSVTGNSQNACGLISRVDGDTYTATISKNMIATSSVTSTSGATTHSIINDWKLDNVTFEDNYLLNKTVYSDGTKSLTNEDDKNGKQISWIEATTKDFYVSTLGWDFTNTWKFTCGGKYPILKIMADEALPTQDVIVSAAGYATMVANYDYDFTGASVETYAVTASATPGYVHLEPVTSAKHGEALLLKGGADTYTLTATAVAKDVTAENLLKAAEEDVVSNGTLYALAKIDGIVGFYQVGTAESAVTIPAGKAYLQVSSPVKAFYGFDEDDATAIEMVNGQSSMVNEIYNLAGQRMNKMQKGINIINGKKVMVK